MGETKIILGFGVLVSCLSPMIAGSSPSDLSQGPSLEAEWAFALPEGVEVVDVIILRDGQIAYTTTQSRFVNVLSVDGAPADSIELPHPPFSVAVNVAGGWEAIDLSQGRSTVWIRPQDRIPFDL